MKILATGTHNTAFKSVKINRLRSRTSFTSWPAALRDLGHDVTHRRVGPDDDARNYDLIFCGVMPVGKVVAYELFATMHLLGIARRAGVPVVLVDNDWSVKLQQIQAHAAHYAYKPEKVFENRFLVQRRHSGWALAPENGHVRDVILDGLAALAEDDWPWIRATWPWAPHEPYQRDTKRAVWLLDPSSYVDFPEMEAPVSKERAWIVSSLTDHSRQLRALETAWPIDFYTTRLRIKFPDPMINQLYCIKQDQLFREQGKVAGGILAHYQHKPGWWRHQMVTLPRVQSVVWLPTSDAGNLSTQHFGQDIHEIEAMSPDQLRGLARAQGQEVAGWIWPKEKLCTELAMLIRDVMDGRVLA